MPLCGSAGRAEAGCQESGPGNGKFLCQDDISGKCGQEEAGRDSQPCEPVPCKAQLGNNQENNLASLEATGTTLLAAEATGLAPPVSVPSLGHMPAGQGRARSHTYLVNLLASLLALLAL